jgi:YodL-like
MNKVNYKIYQWKKVFSYFHSFMDLERYKRIHKQEININRYNVTYDSVIELQFENEIEILEKLFRKFNIEHPKDFKSYSLSVGDIVEIFDKFYYCDSVGWKEIQVDKEIPKVAIQDYLIFEHEFTLDELIEKKRLETKDEKIILKYVSDLSEDFKQFCWEEGFEPQKVYFMKEKTND